jgi:hypothetical protein
MVFVMAGEKRMKAGGRERGVALKRKKKDEIKIKSALGSRGAPPSLSSPRPPPLSALSLPAAGISGKK